MLTRFHRKECPGSCWLRVCVFGQSNSEAFSSGSCFVGPGAQAPPRFHFATSTLSPRSWPLAEHQTTEDF